MLELQRDLSAAIARQVRLRLSPDRLTALAHRHTRNAEAYEFYLRGRHLWNQLTPETNRRAVEFYQKATRLDSGFALAWAGLADIYSASPINSDVPPRDVSAQARDAAARAVASGSSLAETQTALGTVHYWLDWDWPEAEISRGSAVSSTGRTLRLHAHGENERPCRTIEPEPPTLGAVIPAAADPPRHDVRRFLRWSCCRRIMRDRLASPGWAAHASRPVGPCSETAASGRCTRSRIPPGSVPCR
jgi:hypothetical protein